MCSLEEHTSVYIFYVNLFENWCVCVSGSSVYVPALFVCVCASVVIEVHIYLYMCVCMCVRALLS